MVVKYANEYIKVNEGSLLPPSNFFSLSYVPQEFQVLIFSIL